MRYFELMQEVQIKGIDRVSAETGGAINIIEMIIRHVKNKDRRLSDCELNREMFKWLKDGKTSTENIAKIFLTDYTNVDVRLRAYSRLVGENFSQLREEAKLIDQAILEAQGCEELNLAYDETIEPGDCVNYEHFCFDYALGGSENTNHTYAKVVAVNLKDYPFPTAVIQHPGHFGPVVEVVQLGRISKRKKKSEKK